MKVIRYIILISLFLFIACIGYERKAWTVKDTWYNAPMENGLVPWDWKENKIYEVKPELQNEAQSLLNEKQITQITLDQVNYFSGKELKNIAAYDFYLIRGVFLNEGTGYFSVYSKEKQVWVYHGSLGHSPVPMKRKALIVVLDEMPDIIFVTCMMDE